MKVKEKKLAKRCEICHQTDCFDAMEEYCSRCNGLKLLKVETKSGNEEAQIKIQSINRKPTIRTALTGNIIGAILAFFCVPNFMSSHWWKYDDRPIILWIFLVLLGQIIWPFLILQNVHKQTVIRLFSYSIAGLIGAIVFSLIYGVVQIFLQDNTFDVCLTKYFRIDLLWLVMLALVLSPFLSVALFPIIDKVSKRFNAFINYEIK